MAELKQTIDSSILKGCGVDFSFFFTFPSIYLIKRTEKEKKRGVAEFFHGGGDELCIILEYLF